MRWIRFLCVCIVFLAIVASVHAEDFKTDYTVDYYLSQNGNKIQSLVKFATRITNLTDNYYVQDYELTFPDSFALHDISATDDQKSIKTVVTDTKGITNVHMTLNDPHSGRDSVNTFNLQFYQDNLFKINANVWEVILPTIEGRKEGSYTIRVHMPTTNKPLTIAKPKPTRTDNNVIEWDNPSTKTIYAVFGDRQYYSLLLNYHIQNTQHSNVYTEIALPPDTSYQQVLVASLDPQPTSVRIDEDGNYLARYDMEPGARKLIRYKGYAAIYSRPRDEYQSVAMKLFEKQKSYLLSDSKFWNITNKSAYTHLKSPQAIYQSVVGSLSYDYDRINQKSKRLGSSLALAHPTLAVCTEFSDTFVNLARINGIYSREIEGYGFSEDEKLRPISKTNDILHSWPEYFDTTQSAWKAVDPTWENTSGIDYFTSFDLNHIAFAIHGADPADPAPAGTYKTEDTRDVSVEPIATIPDASYDLSAKNLHITSSITDKQTYTGTVDIYNKGNSAAYGASVQIDSPDLKISPDTFAINNLPPYGHQTLEFTYRSGTQLNAINTLVRVKSTGQILAEQQVRVTPMTHTVTVTISAAVAIFVILLLVLILVIRKPRRL